MSSVHEDHGNTPAAWTAVILIIVGFTIGGVAVVFSSIPGVIAGGVVIVIGLVAGKVLQMMGFGQPLASADSEAEAAATSESTASDTATA